MKKYKVLFMGTPIFAEKVLATILTLPEIEIVGVVTQPDRVQGRKHEIILSPVKKLAMQHQLKLYQPEKLIELKTELEALDFDVILTCAFGQFIPTSILAMAKVKTLNVHASLLPRLRGGAPIHKAIMYGETKTGISLMQIIGKMDAGGVYCQEEVLIDQQETASSLTAKLIILACQMINKDLINILNNKYPLVMQDESQVTFAYNITHEEEKINWEGSNVVIDRQIRALLEIPGAWTTCQNQIYKIYGCLFTTEPLQKQDLLIKNGTIINITKQGIKVKCIDGYIYLLVIQKAGKSKVLANTFSHNQDKVISIGGVFV